MRPGESIRCFPWLIVIATGFLVATGWLGIARCEELGGGSFVVRQVVWSLLAGLAVLAAAFPNFRTIARWSYGLFLLALALLVLVYLFPAVNGARRWIRLGPIGLQPSEFAKVAYIMALARYLMYRDTHRRLSGLLVPLGLTLLPVLLILREPDLGTALVFVPVFFVMLFAAGSRRSDLLKFVVAAVLLAPFLWIQMSHEQRSRVTALFDQAGPREKATHDAYHLRQAKQMFALGSLWGSAVTGPAVEDPAVYQLPEAHSDFILCVLGERFGLVGVAVVLGVYAVFVWRGLAVAQATRDPFGRLVAAGLAALMAVQVLINAGMTVGLLPITGLSLPLVSYGGSGLVANGLAVGLLVNIAIRPGYDLTKEPFRYASKSTRRRAA
jgi:cell division protein FtsW (lipid II flippase)